jgi:hypothetical protein
LLELKRRALELQRHVKQQKEDRKMIDQPVIGNRVEVVKNDCCEAEKCFGTIVSIYSKESFRVKPDENYQGRKPPMGEWACCRQCVNPA